MANYDIGFLIKSARVMRGKSQEEVASNIGVTREMFSNYERNKRDVPFSRLIDFLNYIGMPVDLFLKLGEVQPYKEGDLKIYKRINNLDEKRKQKIMEFMDLMR